MTSKFATFLPFIVCVLWISGAEAATGGPDDYGHYWSDSEPFTWIDASTGTDTGVDSDDGYFGPFPIGFTFQWYGNDYTEFHVTPNGAVVFSLGTSNIINCSDYGTTEAQNFITLGGDRAIYSTDGAWIRYRLTGASPNRQLVVEFHRLRGEYDFAGHYLDLEIVLFENGGLGEKAVLATDNFVGSPYTAAYIGIENASGEDNLVYEDACPFSNSYYEGMVITFSEIENEGCPGEAIDISDISTSSVTVTGSTSSVADDIDEEFDISCWSFSDAAEHVYQFTPSSDQGLQIDMIGSSYDTKLAIVDTCPSGAGFCQYNDDYSGTDAGFDCLNFDGGTTYSIIVSGFSGATGSYQLNIDACDMPRCGDGTTDPGEECDDGNESNEDACLNSCENAECGDGYIRSGVEECDDANTINTDACLNSCEDASCGDGYIWAGEEECDDENFLDNDACVNCEDARCGDGHVWTGEEECDNGSDNSDSRVDACRTDCVRAFCGDGVIDTGEACDDGDDNSDTDPDACRTNCSLSTCGDGHVDTGEECDLGTNNSDTEPDGCRTTCLNAYCGDEVTDSDEECDEGDENSNTEVDGCRTNCVRAFCGDGVTDSGEQCDNGEENSDDIPGGCSTECRNNDVEADGDADTDVDVDSDADTDADTDTDVDADGDSDGDADNSGGDGGVGYAVVKGCACRATGDPPGAEGLLAVIVALFFLGISRRAR